jgi:octopine/nopaline transport system permease protein
VRALGLLETRLSRHLGPIVPQTAPSRPVSATT